MKWLSLILIIHVSLICASRPLSLQDSDFFNKFLFTVNGKIGNYSYVNYLSSMKAFDFMQTGSGSWNGVIFWITGDVTFSKRTTKLCLPQPIQSCTCSIVKPLDFLCDHCKLFQSKLRNGIFYCGNNCVCSQNEKGDVFIQQYDDAGKPREKRDLFLDFPKINHVTLTHQSIIFEMESRLNLRLAYMYKMNKFGIMLEGKFLDLEVVYRQKFPWMIEKEQVGKHNNLNISNGDLIVQGTGYPLFVSLWGKIAFDYISHIDKAKEMIYLKTCEGKDVIFQARTATFSELSETPAYDHHEVGWVYMADDQIVYTQINQSLLGKYAGQYLLRLKQALLNWKGWVYELVLVKYIKTKCRGARPSS